MSPNRAGALHSNYPQCCLTWRSNGPIAAGRHLGYKSLAQIPVRRNRPFSFNVRHHPETTATFINSARRDASPHKNNTQFEFLAKFMIYLIFRLELFFVAKPCWRNAFKLSAVLPNRALNRTYCGGPAFGLKKPSPNTSPPQ